MAVYYTSPQSFIKTFSYSPAFQLWGLLRYRGGNFEYYHWGCTSIYRRLSYPFRSPTRYSGKKNKDNFHMSNVAVMIMNHLRDLKGYDNSRQIDVHPI